MEGSLWSGKRREETRDVDTSEQTNDAPKREEGRLFDERRVGRRVVPLRQHVPAVLQENALATGESTRDGGVTREVAAGETHGISFLCDASENEFETEVL